tara:strand:- start:84 stop:449 length:366 start_codon:yes stop_codon:yes gene_type:complete
MKLEIKQNGNWSCVNCFEHITTDMIDNYINDIIKKIKKDSKGHIWINLTDHSGGFEHYKTGLPEFKYIAKDGNKTFCNTIKSDKWKTIFAKYFDFTYEEKYLDNIKEYPSTAIFNNVRLKK